MTNLVFGGGQSVDEVDTVVVPRASDDVARTDDELVTEAEENVVFLLAVAIDEVEVEVSLVVDPSLGEETTILVAVALNEVDEADLVVELPLLLEIPFLSLFIWPDTTVPVVTLADDDVERVDDELVVEADDTPVLVAVACRRGRFRRRAAFVA